MRTGVRVFWSIGALVAVVGLPGRARADETDNFTCRSRLMRDSQGALDALMNSQIQAALELANSRGAACDAACVVRELQTSVGASRRHWLTGIPHARFEKWIDERSDIDRCHLEFKESIYGARAYNQFWLFPVNGRVIWLADSIRLSGRVVGLDKINHFIREGLAHRRAVERPGGEITDVMQRELGPPGRQWRWNERGLKGLSFTGILSYADLAASYSGFRFWSDLLSIGRAGSFVAYDTEAEAFVQRRDFTFAEYVNDAWDEGINYSTFHPTLARQVSKALRSRSMTSPVSDCRRLIALPQAGLYVNPACLASTGTAFPLPSDHERRARRPVVTDDVLHRRVGGGRQFAERDDVVSPVHLKRESTVALEHPAHAIHQREGIRREWRLQVRPDGTVEPVADDADAHAGLDEKAALIPRPQLANAEHERRADRIVAAALEL
jgi:hypothetical protein